MLAELENQHALAGRVTKPCSLLPVKRILKIATTPVLPADEVKTLKDELKEANAEWKASSRRSRALWVICSTEIKVARRLPRGTDKAHYCSDGFTARTHSSATASVRSTSLPRWGTHPRSRQ